MPKNRIVQTILETKIAFGNIVIGKQKYFKVDFLNSKLSVKVSSDESIYEAALNAGLQLPIGCKYGGCISCAAKLKVGKVRQPGATALNKRQSKEGYILLCVARPTSNCTIEEGFDSHSELYQNPFLSATFER